jgi:hypothetical protein
MGNHHGGSRFHRDGLRFVILLARLRQRKGFVLHVARNLKGTQFERAKTGEIKLEGATAMRTSASSERPQLTLLEVVDVVSRCSRSDREAAAVINHLLLSSQLRFANGAPRVALRRMLS